MELGCDQVSLSDRTTEFNATIFSCSPCDFRIFRHNVIAVHKIKLVLVCVDLVSHRVSRAEAYTVPSHVGYFYSRGAVEPKAPDAAFENPQSRGLSLF